VYPDWVAGWGSGLVPHQNALYRAFYQGLDRFSLRSVANRDQGAIRAAWPHGFYEIKELLLHAFY
jgi:hypothetical protein